MQKEPLLILVICFILGIFFQDHFSLSFLITTVFLIFTILLTGLFFIKNFYFFKLRPVFLGLLFFSSGLFAHLMHSQKPILPILKGKEVITFKISKKLNSNEKNRRYEIVAWKDHRAFKSVLSFPKDEPELDYLHYYKAELYINKLEKPYSDFQFDYGKYLSRKGIYFQSYMPNSRQTSNRTDVSLKERIRQKRLETLSKIDKTSLQKRTREFTKGIILADRTEMDKQTVRDFRDSGMMHILAISGTHMAIIFGVILVILNMVVPPKYRTYKIIIVLILIWMFAVFIDFGNSVIRSCIMITSYYIYVLLQRKTDLLHSMAIAGFIILIGDTNQLFEVGFQLSFMAVFGIYWFNQPILKYLPKPRNKFQNFMVNVFSISMSAQLATMPLVIYYFHQYSFISIIANLVIIPFAEIVIVFSLVMVILIGFSVNLTWLNIIYDSLVTGTLKLIHFFGNIDFAMHKMIPMTLLEVIVLFIVLYYLRFPINNFTIKNGLKFIYFVLIFFSLRLLLNYGSVRNDEVLVHPYFKENVISVKEGGIVTFYFSETSDQEKLIQYIVHPYLTSRRTKNYRSVPVQRNTPEIIINGEKYNLKR